MNVKERKLQDNVLMSLRRGGTLPSLSQMARESGTSISTVSLFMHGNSTNNQLVVYVAKKLRTGFRSDDTNELLKVWAKYKLITI